MFCVILDPKLLQVGGELMIALKSGRPVDLIHVVHVPRQLSEHSKPGRVAD